VGSSGASIFERHLRLEAWMSAIRCLVGLHFVFDLAVGQCPFEGDELALLENLGEL
jgi:hypothetical protein